MPRALPTIIAVMKAGAAGRIDTNPAAILKSLGKHRFFGKMVARQAGAWGEEEIKKPTHRATAPE